MTARSRPPDGRPGEADVSPARLFTLTWDALAETLGVPTTATLLRRSSKKARADSGERPMPDITREGLDYRYAVPAEWERPSDAGLRAFESLLTSLVPFLTELTGELIVRRLAQIPELQRFAVLTKKEKSK